MEQIINFTYSNAGPIMVGIAFIFALYAELKHRPEIERQTALTNARDKSSRLILAIRDEKNLQDLKAMIYEIKIVTELNKQIMTKDEAEKYNRKIWEDYDGQKTYLFNVEHLGLPQSLLPVILN